MLRKSEEIDCIIFDDCLTRYAAEDIQILKDNFGLYEYDHFVEFDPNTYKEIVKRYNTFRVITTVDVYEALKNSYRLPDNTWLAKHWNEKYREHTVGLDEYLNIEEIKQLTYFEYEDEHIHSIYNQDKSQDSFVYCSSKDLALVSKKLKAYLENNAQQQKLDTKYVTDLQKIELLSAIAARYDSDFLFILWGLF